MWAAMPPHTDPLGAMPMILEYTYLLREASQLSKEVKVTHDGRSYQVATAVQGSQSYT